MVDINDIVKHCVSNFSFNDFVSLTLRKIGACKKMYLVHQEEKSPFKLAYKGLKYVGIINQEGRPLSLVYTTVFISPCILLLFCSMADLVWGQEELPEFVAAFSTFAISIQVNGKIFNILRNQKEIHQLIVSLETLRQEILEDQARKHLILLADRFSKRIALYYGIFFITCPTFSAVSNITIDWITGSQKPHLVLQMWLPWSVTDVGTYLAATTLVMVCTFPTASIYVAFSTFNFIFTFEFSAYLQVLQSKLETLNLSDKEVYRLHIEIIRILRCYNKIFAGQIYTEIFISSLQPCGFGFTFIKALRKYDLRALDLINKFIVCIIAPFMLCACGQEISTQLEKLHASSYMCNWYEQKPTSRRYLLQVMAVTVKPTAVNFRKMVVFNYVCFATVAQGIYSYLMMVNQFGEDD